MSPNINNLFELSDTKQLKKSSHQISFGSVKPNCNTVINSLVDGHKNEDLLSLRNIKKFNEIFQVIKSDYYVPK